MYYHSKIELFETLASSIADSNRWWRTLYTRRKLLQNDRPYQIVQA